MNKRRGMGAMIFWYRQLTGYSLEEVEGLIGLGRNTLCDLESGRTKDPGLRVLRLLTNALGIPPKMWFEDDFSEFEERNVGGSNGRDTSKVPSGGRRRAVYRPRDRSQEVRTGLLGVREPRAGGPILGDSPGGSESGQSECGRDVSGVEEKV